jgi:hypothetical protein
VNPNGQEVSDCHFDYGEDEAYGSSMPCSSLPGAGKSPVEVSTALAGLSANTTYHYRIVATNEGGTSYSEDERFTTLGPPDFGRCLKVAGVREGGEVVYHGAFTTKTCTEPSVTNMGKFEWYPGVIKTGFTSVLKKGEVKLETFARERVTCKTESSAGDYSGLKEVKGVVIKFTGCEILGRQCTTSGLGEGELETRQLEGKIGWEDKAIGEVALDLHPVTNAGVFMEYRCAGGAPVTVEGSLIAPVKTDKLLGTATMKYKARRGIQKLERLEGEPIDVLTASLNGEAFEPLGVTFLATQSNEEPVEVNTLY